MIDFDSISHTIPTTPGVYIYRDKRKKVLYVGKAINLYNRVKSYFAVYDVLSVKTQALVNKIETIETIQVQNELEALLLEADLIKRHRPPYNIALKDDKFYKYIKVETDTFAVNGVNKHIKKIVTTRKKTKDGVYFGPFPESNSILLITKTLRKVFPFRDCGKEKFTKYKKLNRPCLYGDIGICPAPCVNKEAVEINNTNIKKIGEYLTGKRSLLINQLKTEMQSLAKKQEYEKAAYIRDQLDKYDYLTQTKSEISEYVKNPDVLQDKAAEAVKNLTQMLTKELGIQFTDQDLATFRIETFDISNISGTNAVGAMSVTTGGVIDKREYRKFKIRLKSTPDDFFMLTEVITRRFNKVNKKKWKTPDLIVIDGGKGQLSTAIEVLSAKKIKIPVISLAKKLEEIYYFDTKDKDFKVIQKPKSDTGLNLLILGRNETHRFGITYHRKLRLGEIYQKSD